MTARLPALGRVDVSGLTQPKIDVDIVRQRMNDHAVPVRGAQGGSVTLQFMLPGLGGTTAGAVPASDMATFLGLVFGTSAQSAASGTTATGGTVTVPTTTASGTISPGAMVRIGAITESRGRGQAYAVATHATTNLTLLNAMVGAPNNGDVVYTGRMVYPYEDPTTAGDVSSIRLGLRTANQQYICRGCYPTAASFTDLGPGQQPKVSVTFGVASWESANDTFPVTTTLQTHSGMTVAGGSLFYNTVGTATRVTRDIRSFELSIEMETIPLMGPGGNTNFQATVAARRARQTAMVSWTEDAEAAGTSTPASLWDSDENSAINKHVLYTLNTRDGGSAAFYFPNLQQTGERPTQMDANGLNQVKYAFRAATGPTSTSALTLSSWRLGMF